MDVTTWTRHSLFLLIALLAVLGNTPQHVANAQQGTTARRTTLRKTTIVPGGGGGANAATTLALQRTTIFAGGNQGPTANASPRQTQPSNGQATTLRSNVGGGGGSVLTSPPGGGSNNGVITTTRPSGIVTSRVSQAQTTRLASATSPTPDTSRVIFDYEYRLSESSNAIIGFESICASNSKNDFAARLNINPLQVILVKCTGTSNQDVLVEGSITEGSTPTAQDMENFKVTTDISTLYFKGARGSSVALVRGSFKYSKREQSDASSSGGERRILGLTETHWVLIGMGAVILILFSISLGVILTSRRFAPKKKLDEESSSGADSDTEEKPKKKWFGFMKGKKKDESDSDSDDSDSASDGSSTDGSVKSEEEEEKKKKKKGFGLFKKKDKKEDDISVSTRTDAESAYESTKDGDDYDQLPNDQSSNIPEEHKIV